MTNILFKTYGQSVVTGEELLLNGSTEEPASLPVHFSGFSAIGENRYSIQLNSPRGSAILDDEFDIPIDVPDSEFFSWIARISVETRKKGPACFVQSSLEPASPDGRSFRLESKLLWEDLADFQGTRGWTDLLQQCFPEECCEGPPSWSSKWSPRDFYDNVHIPEKTDEPLSEIQSSLVQCKLYPFQRRAVRWLLEREGVEIHSTGEVHQFQSTTASELPFSVSQHVDTDGRPIFVSSLFGTVSSGISTSNYPYMSLRGGILAEEMGLGKTVEMITLICLHRRRFDQNNGNGAALDDQAGLTQSGATLIISPPSILEQWKQEIQTHAPSLHVIHYEGIQRHQNDYDNEQLVRELSSCDVVVTTYNVLAKEIYYAEETPERSLRNRKRFPPRKTPLVQISWWRVCLDEAQMIESGVGNAAKVARRIPRHNAWAVSGTPIRKDAKDLYGLLLFLDYEPFCFSQTIWFSLLDSYMPVLRSIVGRLALRHTKEFIRDELSLPSQKRIVITIPFTAVEEQHYDNIFSWMCGECGFDSSGGPMRYNWDPESQSTIDKMRFWLTRLRQTCLHPEISEDNRRALGSTNALRSVDEVLEVMMEQSTATIRAEERAFIMSQIRRGQMHENAYNRHEALAIWKQALETSEGIVQECREQLAERLAGVEDGGYLNSVAASKIEEEGTEKNSRIGTCRRSLRSALEVHHVCIFFTANAYFQIKSDPNLTGQNSEQFKELEKLEEEAYEAAKTIRKELLSDAMRKVSRFTDPIELKAKKKELVALPRLQPTTYHGGLESQDLIDRFENICEALNNHAKQYDEWRNDMVNLLLKSLIDQEDGTKLEGDEYETSTKHQDEMYVYMEALRGMFADRHGAITGQSNELIAHETKQGIIQAKKGEGPSPKLFLSVCATRENLKPDRELGSLRGIVSELRSLVTSLEWQASGGSRRARTELEIVNAAFSSASQMAVEQSKVLSKLEKEVELFRDTMNIRLAFYRQLQHISDMVAPYQEDKQGEPLDVAAFDRMIENENKLDAKISGLRSKLRYLFHLRDESGEDESTRTCVICQSSFEIGTPGLKLFSNNPPMFVY